MVELINERLLKTRKKHQLSRQGLENISGFKERTIGAYERGERTPSKEYVEFMSLYFGLHEKYFTGTGDYYIDFGKAPYLERSHEELYALDSYVQKILMHKSIYDLSDQQMCDLLNWTIEEYEETIKQNYVGDREYYLFKVAEALKQSPSSWFIDKEYVLKDANFDESENEKIELLSKRFDYAENNFTSLTTDEYASVVRKRNHPDHYIPVETTDKIPEKYKEIVELLPFAPDSFIDTLIEKLKAMREAQKL